MRAYYRIVEDEYSGYEVQVWRWWFPVWVQMGFCNTYSSVHEAEAKARAHARCVVKYLGKL